MARPEPGHTERVYNLHELLEQAVPVQEGRRLMAIAKSLGSAVTSEDTVAQRPWACFVRPDGAQRESDRVLQQAPAASVAAVVCHRRDDMSCLTALTVQVFTTTPSRCYSFRHLE